MRAPILVLLLGLSICAASCDGDTDDDGGAQGASCEALADAYCGKIDSCAPGLLALFFGDLATCSTRAAMGCELDRNAPDSGYDDAWAGACRDALDAASCDDVFAAGVPECDAPAGARADGAACGDDAQCQSSYCDSPGAGCGTCRARIPAGGACADAPQACEAGTRCGFNQQCVLLGVQGDACDDDQPCTPLYACIEGTCATGGGPGETCEVGSSPCDFSQQLLCNGEVCAKFELAGAGEPCGLVGGSLVACAAGECVNGTCAAPGEDGQACGGDDGDLCLSPAECDAGVCTVLDPASC
jgi:hypothetical protein